MRVKLLHCCGGAGECDPSPNCIDGPPGRRGLSVIYSGGITDLAGNALAEVTPFSFSVLDPTDPGERPADAFDLGLLSEEQTLNAFISALDPSDYYRFNLDAPSDFMLTLSHPANDADVRLVQDANGNGERDDGETIFDPNENETISLLLETGTYFVEVYDDPRVVGGTSYTLSLSATEIINPNPPADPGETPADAFDLGLLSEEQTLNAFISALDPSDYYRFNLDAPSDFMLTLSHPANDADVRLVQDANGNGERDDGETIFDPNENETISLLLETGTYFVEVYDDPRVVGEPAIP